ncbi:MAG: sensor histidine kinase [Phocaeicola sp.]|uniref:sensor histidine kinase n=1 Tax=Phocaeicola TaxID=909656 RepID=UPI00234E3E28|nr:histidine kinase [Phocaeicola oris]MCE2616605.1 histidine kinase [Phocaeicola oris]
MTKKDRNILYIQIGLIAALLLLMWLIGFSSGINFERGFEFVFRTIQALYPFLIVYFVNFYLLAPFLFEKKKYGWFVLANIGVILLANITVFFVDYSNIPKEVPQFAILFGFFFIFILDFIVAFVAVGIRSVLKVNEMRQMLQEEQQKNTEAELLWLKNQLNPHFLFNTLNNISGLIQIDPDAAQDSIAKLSDLLRYTLYESNQDFVPVAGEIEFMENYIDLMKLRCGSNTTVTTDFDIRNGSIKIAPLLFISLIENAFKHGVSNSKPSVIRMEMHTDGNQLFFLCENSNYPKDDKNRSGSGIGLDNLKRRLELLYKGKYTFEKILEDEMYKVTITLKNLTQ